MMTVTDWGNVNQCQSIEISIRKAYQSPRTALLTPRSPGDLVKM